MMENITPKDLQEKIRQKDLFYLIDVREEFEHEDFNIGGTLIPLGEVLGRASEIPTEMPVVIYCRKGIRSQIAIQRLEEKFGFRNLVNLAGGVEEWKKTVS
jgi:rhodanese-related sulfurtransferase